MAFGAGLTRGKDEVPSWAERAAHGTQGMRVARRQKSMQIESIQQLVNSQSVEQMMGVLARHRRSLEQVSEFLPTKAAKVLTNSLI